MSATSKLVVFGTFEIFFLREQGTRLYLLLPLAFNTNAHLQNRHVLCNMSEAVEMFLKPGNSLECRNVFKIHRASGTAIEI